MERRFKLLKDLPNCPKGRIFKETIWGYFFLYQTTDELIRGNNLKSYQFKKEEVESNTDLFMEICEVKYAENL